MEGQGVPLCERVNTEMAFKHPSIRISVGIIVVAMGLMGMVLALVTGAVYHDVTLENHRVSLVNVTRLKTQDLLRSLTEQSRDLGLGVQHSANFNEAFDQRKQTDLTKLLNNQFHQYFSTANIVKLEKLYLFDSKFNLMLESTETDAGILPHQVICSGLLDHARKRQGAARLQTLSDLCMYNAVPYHMVIVPVGGLRIKGYLGVVTDPIHRLMSMESALGMPLQLKSPLGTLLYTSPSWPHQLTEKNTLNAAYTLISSRNGPIIIVSVANDINQLIRQLQRTRNLIMAGISIVIVLAMLLALAVFQRTTLKPMNALTEQLRLVRNDRMHLGEEVSVDGNKEIMELAVNFNAMMKELKKLYGDLENLAYTDTLTSLPNRTQFNERLSHAVSLHGKNNSKFAVLVMDIDRFKEINDTLGHQIGDLLLMQVAIRLQSVLQSPNAEQRSVDEAVARLGGDEFATILLTVSDKQDAAVVAVMIQKAMERPFIIEQHSLTVGMSIGIVLFPADGLESEALLRHADIAMYQAKRHQQSFAFYEISQDKNNLSVLTMINDLHLGIEQNQLVLHYQPKIDMRTGKICGAEALVRWQHPQRGFISPDNFIPLAEKSGAIIPLTTWVLNRALADCAIWHKAGLEIPVAVNLSARSLGDFKITAQILDMASVHNMATRWLHLELTETAIMVDSGRALKILSALNNEGVHIAVDDFGIGYSSLAYLKQLPVKEIKIDRSFVMDMQQDGNDAIIVRSTIDLAHNMSLLVTAEGVENKATWDLLLAQGCDIAQGYFIERPIPADKFLQWAIKHIESKTATA